MKYVLTRQLFYHILDDKWANPMEDQCVGEKI